MKKMVMTGLVVMCLVLALVPVSAFAAPVATFGPNDTFAFPSDGTYAFTGTFTNDVVINVPAGRSSITLDAGGAVFEGNVRIRLDHIADGTAHINASPRTGEYTIQNFNVENSLSIGCCTALSVKVTGNKVGAMDFDCSNSNVVVSGNTINSTKNSYARFNAGSTHDGGLFVYADRYDLTLSDNVITSQANAITVVGNYEQYQQHLTYENSLSISKNTLAANRIFKVWNDKTYAPVEWPNEYTLTSEMRGLSEQLFTANTIEVSCEHSVVDVLMRKTGGSDMNATEKNFDALKAIADNASYTVWHPADHVISVEGGWICNLCGAFFPDEQAPAAVSQPKTGDDSNLMLWAGLMLLAGIGMVVAGKKRLSADR